MRARILVFAAVVAIALALNLARLSLSIGQTGEDTLRARLATASSALRAQLDLLDARLSPRAVATAPELIETTRVESGQAPARPDERTVRAAASALSPEPDLVAVATSQGAMLLRRGKAAAGVDNIGQLPLARAAMEGNPAPAFASFDGATWRIAAARVPGNPAAVIVGTLVDDRLALQLKSQVDADVTLLQGGKIIASSLPADERTKVAKWASAPGPGYGVLRVVLPLVGADLSGKLPRGTSRFAVRGALVPADGAVQVALTVPASPYTAWLARYQAFYVAALVLFLLFSLVWALLAREKRRPAPANAAAAKKSNDSDGSGDVSAPRAAAPAITDVPWQSAETAQKPEPEAPGIAGRENEPREETWGAEPLAQSPAQPEAEPWGAAPAGKDDEAPWGTPEPHAAEADAAPWSAAPAASGSDTWGAEPANAAAVETSSANGAQTAVPDLGEGPTGGIGPTDSPEPTGFPGEEPARVDAANLDAADGAVSAPPAASAATLQDFAMPAADERDPDEAHWRETFDHFKELKERLGEPSDRISFEKFAAKLRKNRTDLLAKHNCKGVRFSVYEKEGKAAIKASAIR